MYCMFCGKQIEEDSRVCRHCGRRVADTPADGEHIRVVSNRDPLYRIECEYCLCVFEYKNKHLGYRPWYPSGFVYCPNCKKPLRHKTEYEVKEE